MVLLNKKTRSGAGWLVCAPGHRQKQITKLRWGGVPDSCFVLSSDHRHHSNATCFFIAVFRQCNRVYPLLTWPPLQLRAVDSHSIEPCRFPAYVPVVPLLDVTCPAAEIVGLYPSAHLRWRCNTMPFPGVAVCRVLNHTPMVPHSGQRRSEATAVFSKVVQVWFVRCAMPIAAPAETPPRAWGRRIKLQCASRTGGNTPTCVGKTRG